MPQFKISLVTLLLAFALTLSWWEALGVKPGLSMTKKQRAKTPIITVLVKQLHIPWAMDFLAADKILVSERPGRVSLIDLHQGKASVKVLASIKDVAAFGEGGLLGLAVHPDFKHNHFIYLYYTYVVRGRYWNKVVRYQLLNDKLEQATTIIATIPGAAIHDGGRIRFGPDGYLYITTGDAQVPQAAQNLKSLAGKILRLNDDGSIPASNPFSNSAVYSYGHRNPQGIAWDADGGLWETEHGANAHDEINLIMPGGNYGWPIIIGSQSKKGMEKPFLQSGYVTWAPSGAEILNGVLYFAGLQGRALYGFNLKSKQLNKYLSGDLGRLREIKLGSDNLLYVTTNNRDGRGKFKPEDDRIVIINPTKLNRAIL